jgi:hypothetical protein
MKCIPLYILPEITEKLGHNNNFCSSRSENSLLSWNIVGQTLGTSNRTRFTFQVGIQEIIPRGYQELRALYPSVRRMHSPWNATWWCRGIHWLLLPCVQGHRLPGAISILFPDTLYHSMFTAYLLLSTHKTLHRTAAACILARAAIRA